MSANLNRSSFRALSEGKDKGKARANVIANADPNVPSTSTMPSTLPSISTMPSTSTARLPYNPPVLTRAHTPLPSTSTSKSPAIIPPNSSYTIKRGVSMRRGMLYSQAVGSASGSRDSRDTRAVAALASTPASTSIPTPASATTFTLAATSRATFIATATATPGPIAGPSTAARASTLTYAEAIRGKQKQKQRDLCVGVRVDLGVVPEERVLVPGSDSRSAGRAAPWARPGSEAGLAGKGRGKGKGKEEEEQQPQEQQAATTNPNPNPNPNRSTSPRGPDTPRSRVGAGWTDDNENDNNSGKGSEKGKGNSGGAGSQSENWLQAWAEPPADSEEGKEKAMRERILRWLEGIK